MTIDEKIKKEEKNGVIEELILGKERNVVGYFKDGIVYEQRFGSSNVIGYVKDGVAYENVYGGPPRVIGRVRETKE
jgi:hypothetical protein